MSSLCDKITKEILHKNIKLREIRKMYERQSYQGLHMCNRRMFKAMAQVYTAKLQTLSWATWMFLCLTAPALLSKAVNQNRMYTVQDSRVNEQGHSQTTHIMMQKLLNLGYSKILYTWAQNVQFFFLEDAYTQKIHTTSSKALQI